jgi:hypothetical protein
MENLAALQIKRTFSRRWHKLRSRFLLAKGIPMYIQFVYENIRMKF